jgi:predicted DNA-binding transcriptional regulator AlpA
MPVTTHGPAVADLKRRILTPSETAARLGLTKDELRLLRQRGGGPMFVVLTRKSVRYLRSSVDEWDAQNPVADEALSA